MHKTKDKISKEAVHVSRTVNRGPWFESRRCQNFCFLLISFNELSQFFQLYLNFMCNYELLGSLKLFNIASQ